MNRVYDEILPKTIDALEATDFDYIKQKFGTISGSTICTGSGGSSVVSQYLAKILNAKNGCVAESRYPRELKFMNLTNYDNVIESQVMKDYDIAHIPYLVNASIPLDNKFIVYLHGKYENGNYDDLVLTRKHYNDVYVLEQNEKKQRQKLFFNRLLKDYHIIFLGYSLQDTEIVQLILEQKIYILLHHFLPLPLNT